MDPERFPSAAEGTGLGTPKGYGVSRPGRSGPMINLSSDNQDETVATTKMRLPEAAVI